MPRAPVIALIASVALNLFLIAAVGVVMFLGAGPGRRIQQPVLRHAAQSLNPADRAAFLTMLRTQGRAAKPSNQRARALRLEGWGSLGDPTFDPTAAKAKLAEARNLNLATRSAVEDAVVDFAASLPPSERVALGEALRATTLQNNGLPVAKPAGKP